MRKILIIFFLATLLCGCIPTTEAPSPAPTKPLHKETMEPSDSPEKETGYIGEIDAQVQLLCAADSWEEAEELAELYGITLVEYENGIARFYTEEDPREVIRRGKDNGWPTLELNRISHPF